MVQTLTFWLFRRYRLRCSSADSPDPRVVFTRPVSRHQQRGAAKTDKMTAVVARNLAREMSLINNAPVCNDKRNNLCPRYNNVRVVEGFVRA